jgi:hypothetical protein
MPRIGKRLGAIALTGALFTMGMVQAADPSASFKKGTPDIKSAGPLAFGPEGILFVGDTQGAAVFAIETGDRATTGAKSAVEMKDVAGKIAAMLGTDAKQVMVNDLAVNPLSGNVYLSVSRGRGTNAIPVIVRVKPDGKLDEVSMENIRFAKAEIPNAPAPGVKVRGQEQRNESITDLAFADGRLFVAGLSNEEFSSRLIAIPYPFSGEGVDGAAVEIYHGAHGQIETKSPIRTFVTYKIGSEPYMLAAYTCTPLVKVPVSELKSGAHVKGTTIAELGNRNRPLDMIVYQKDGNDFILMANSSRGVMKIPTEGAATEPGIKERVDGTKGLKYETIAEMKGIMQLDQLGDKQAVVLQQNADGLDLKTIDLP